MIVLGIETSCDETAAALVEDGRRILSNVIASQIELHRLTGGVVPEVAAREHVIKLPHVIKRALKGAQKNVSDIDAIAVTRGPGLLSSLLIGANSAIALAAALRLPLIPVNHIVGHMYANWLTKRPPPQFPIVVLTASGGHSELIFWKGHGEYRFLGSTLDDAAGEAFDKVARLLKLPYPGGPSIERAAIGGNPMKYPLPRAWVTGWDFSFSGLKTAVLRLVQKTGKKASTKQFQRDCAASFQEAVCEVLATKLVNAAVQFHAQEVHVAGGVSANARLRAWTKNLMDKAGLRTLRYSNDLKLCTDNAAMIASAGYFAYKGNPAKYKKTKIFECDPNLPIS